MNVRSGLMVMLLLFAACGPNGRPDPTGGTTPSIPAATDSSNKTAKSSSAVLRTPQEITVSSKPEERAVGTPSPGSDLRMSAVLAKECIHQGEAQALRVETLPKSVVGFDSYYSDGTDGGAMGGNHGGNAGGATDSSGVYQAQWLVSPSAPLGPGHVLVIASHATGSATADIAFRVVAPGESCA